MYVYVLKCAKMTWSPLFAFCGHLTVYGYILALCAPSPCRQDEVVSSMEGQSKGQLKTSQRRLKELESEHKRELREKAKLVDELAVERREWLVLLIGGRGRTVHVMYVLRDCTLYIIILANGILVKNRPNVYNYAYMYYTAYYTVNRLLSVRIIRGYFPRQS